MRFSQALAKLFPKYQRLFIHQRRLYECFTSNVVVNKPFLGNSAIGQVFRVIEEQAQPMFDQDFNLLNHYSWSGGNGALSPQVNNNGIGEPYAYTGMVKTHHRPSDDLSSFGTCCAAFRWHATVDAVNSISYSRKCYAFC